MNKQPQGPKRNTGIYVKFAILMVASALAGAAIGALMFGREAGLQQLLQQVSDGLILAGPWLLAAGLIPCAVAHGLYLAGQKAALRADEDDDAFEAANRRLSLSVSVSTVVMPWMMLTVCLALPAVSVLKSNFFVVAIVPLMLTEIAWSYGLQAAVVRAMQRLAPEKRGNVFDLRFQKDWYASCDEAQPRRIGECRHDTSPTTISVEPFAVRAALLAAMYGGTSVLWAVVLGGLWLVQTLTYLLRAYKLEHGRRPE